MEQQQLDRPAGSPGCWGRQYDDNKNTQSGKECAGCPFNFSCKNATSAAMGRQMSYQQPWQPAWQGQWQGGWQPPPPPPSPPARSLPVWQGNQPPAPPSPPQVPMWPRQQPQMQPAPHPYDQFASVFGQYPGEPIGERLGKNIILRALEAIFMELTRFFHYWPWPWTN